VTLDQIARLCSTRELHPQPRTMTRVTALLNLRPTPPPRDDEEGADDDGDVFVGIKS
jgi:hypothetical protein